MNDVVIDAEVVRSPVPNKPPLELSFPDALREVLNRHKITRLSWGTNDYVLLKDSHLQIFLKGEYHDLIVSDGDMNAIDWVVIGD